eukprot:Colp12_sorted_trinity150504_noHs@27539
MSENSNKRSAGQDLEGKAKKQKSKAYYVDSKKKDRELNTGCKGIYVSCNPNQENKARKEARYILNQYADKLYGAQKLNEDEDDENESIEAALKKEIAGLQSKAAERFTSLDPKAKGAIFFKTSDEVDPVKLLHFMFTDLLETKTKFGRFCMRFVAAEVVCHASPSDLTKTLPDVLAPHFYGQEQALKKFAVQYRSRNNNQVSRDDVIKTIADLVVAEHPHKVDLSNPDLSIVVEINRSLCMVSVVSDFGKLKRYNLQEIAGEKKDIEKKDKASEQKEKKEETAEKEDEEEDEEGGDE